jgi:hypothetical protein
LRAGSLDITLRAVRTLVLLLLVGCSNTVLVQGDEDCADELEPNGHCESDEDCDPADRCDLEVLQTGPELERARYRCVPLSIAGEWCALDEEECGPGLRCEPSELDGYGVCARD